ncbi:MAG: DUF1566 domain-containing protein [Dehalococcoidia bacterium]|nr:DUF1566 domain-containing protein [Dehalococcoidia bacterium]
MIGMKTCQLVLSRLLPKTGQIDVYQAGDDGTYQAGWWRGKTVANNRTRFIAKTIGGDDVVIDRATSLIWAADGTAAGCNNGSTITWSNAIIYAEGLTFAGFSDWRVPNIRELMSILDYNEYMPTIQDPPFTHTKSNIYWSSTTSKNNDLVVWYVNFLEGIITTTAKTGLRYVRVVRGGL